MFGGVADPTIEILAVRRIAGVGDPQAARPQSLDEIVAVREDFLRDYQDGAWARRYRAFVDRVRAAEARAGMGSAALSAAVARSLFKLMSYKDEYEVARLHSSEEFRRALEQQFEGDFTLKFHLAPPLLAERDAITGHLRKREFGPWMMRAFGVLAKFKGLRGTRFDIFGYLPERRQERRLIGDYETLIGALLARLDARTAPLIAEIAALPLAMRGFGHVKERNIEQALARQEELLARLDAPEQVVQIQAA